jgi:hypothetical protein
MRKLPLWAVLMVLIPWSLFILLGIKICSANDFTPRAGRTTDSYKVSPLGSTPRRRTIGNRYTWDVAPTWHNFGPRPWYNPYPKPHPGTNLPICKGRPC